MIAKVLFVTFALAGASSAAIAENMQTVDSYEFGATASRTVKLALSLDFINRKCKGEAIPIYLNQTDFVLNQIGGRSSKSVLENAAEVMGVSPEKLHHYAISEADGLLAQSGGCKSTEFQTVYYALIVQFEGFQHYLVDVANLMHRNPGRNIFR